MQALDLGADNYLTKPFGVYELLARIRALLRRTERVTEGSPTFEAGGVRVDLNAHRVTRHGHDIHLTRTEWGLLDVLASHPGRLLTHRWLLARVWGPGYEDDVEVLRVFVSQLRRKIEPGRRELAFIVTGRAWDIGGRPSRSANRLSNQRASSPLRGPPRGGRSPPRAR